MPTYQKFIESRGGIAGLSLYKQKELRIHPSVSNSPVLLNKKRKKNSRNKKENGSSLENVIPRSREKWPKEFHSGHPPKLSGTDLDERTLAIEAGKINVLTVTWNVHAKPPPDNLDELLPPNRYHMYVIGTEECEHTILQSVIFTSKQRWESLLASSLGARYVPIRSQTLQAINLIIFVHRSILPLVSQVGSDVAAVGLSAPIPKQLQNIIIPENKQRLGNKGGVGICLNLGARSFLFVACHFTAFQDKVTERNSDFAKIDSTLFNIPDSTNRGTLYNGKTKQKNSSNEETDSSSNETKKNSSNEETDSSSNETKYSQLHPTQEKNEFTFSPHFIEKGASTKFDYVIWLGDFNYRINKTREEADILLKNNQYHKLLANDQLVQEMKKGNVFSGFREGKLKFRPTYKFDSNSDIYDTSPKQRVPSWTDRILYRPDEGVEIFSYRSIDSIKTSDHRPVCASFSMPLSMTCITSIDKRVGGGSISESWDGEFGTSKSAVCCIQ